MNNFLLSVCSINTYTKKLFVVFMKYKITRYLVFNLATLVW